MARPSEVQRLNQLVEEQTAQRDPFQSPRMVSAREAGRGALQPGQEPLARQEQVISVSEREAAPQQTLRDFLAESDPQEEERTLKTEVPRKLRGLGLGDLAKGLQLNGLGRLNLLLRLRERFGDRFFENDSARQAISAFDTALERNQTSQEEEMAEAFSNADRTLDELLRMGGQERRR